LGFVKLDGVIRNNMINLVEIREKFELSLILYGGRIWTDGLIIKISSITYPNLIELTLDERKFEKN